jgi:peptidoglycan/LPS O-acetylase OafA/YrhL
VQPVFWSLSVEAFFYLCFPLIYRGIQPLQSRTLGALAVVIYVAMVSTAMLGRAYSGLAFWFVYISPPARLLEFLIGVTLGEALRRSDLPRIPSAIAASAVVGGLLVMPYVPASFRPATVMLWPFVLVISAAYQADAAGRTSLLAWRPMVVAGTWSYAFYLLHATTIGLTVDVLSGPNANSYLVASVALVVASSAAGIAYCFWEMPTQSLIRGWLVGSLTSASPTRAGLRRAGLKNSV